MSREIDLYEPLSETDKQYLMDRGLENQVHENELRFSRSDHVTGLAIDNTDGSDGTDADGADADTAGSDTDADTDEEWVNSLTVEELRDELKERKQSTVGLKPELQERLFLAL